MLEHERGASGGRGYFTGVDGALQHGQLGNYPRAVLFTRSTARQKVDHTLNSQNTPHSSPSRVSYVVNFVNICRKSTLIDWMKYNKILSLSVIRQ